MGWLRDGALVLGGGILATVPFITTPDLRHQVRDYAGETAKRVIYGEL